MPVYNSGNTLMRAVDSVIKQTYTNIQLILIDDGSQDNSPTICDNYALMDPRVEVVHQSNSGASYARNTGLKKVKGEYVAFVDADDVISEMYIEVLLYSAIVTNTKIATCEAFYCTNNDYKIQPVNEIRPQIIKVVDYNFMESWSHATVWGALFHQSILIDLKFDTTIFVGEDSLFFVNALVQCDSISYVPNKLYYYFIYNNSLSHGTYGKNRLTEFNAWKKINMIVSERSNILDSSSKARMVRHAIERYKEVLLNKNINKNILHYLRKIVCENKDYYIEYISTIKRKTEIFLLIKLPWMYDIVYRKNKRRTRNRN